ncbi:CRISPR-associated endonuclease Cas2 [Vibrio cidicii]|uniref:CRISPR-associated endonuclease Cas2 n=1 Tax=Vibrio cidicii TaxID=1763883 RepID=UPI0037501B20|nr:CRISPR-associated endonuclease Cas2 [Vibrio navarrensis]EJL6565994.1 CRISPR-associated endonuclease Cas2 [Vibrio navarrensis]
MIWLISFDISNDKRRRRAVKLLLGYGNRTQYSVFECLLRRPQLRRIQHKMKQIIEPSDRVLYYPICGKDALCRYADGAGQVYWPEALYLIDGE